MLSVIRSREEIGCTVVCQTISQLEARYGEATANSIVGNCDSQLVLGFQDERTAAYFFLRANKTASTLLETSAGDVVGVSARPTRSDGSRAVGGPSALSRAHRGEARKKPGSSRSSNVGKDRMLREIEVEFNVNFEEFEMEDFDERNIA